KSSIYFFDESYMAIASAKENFLAITGNTDNAYFNVSDCLTEASEHADLILCNPPFHQNNTISSHIAIQMFNQAHQQLNKDGELWVIGNRHLKYHHDLKRIYANCRNIASNNKFSIYASLK
ncbi:MAG: class I SAM-dependent methyltransferase, partial [Gammaproteobacteria bacterium]|nr:class I SAM-dependent methyltransferase [Gammaproteobacteria bacterium]